MKLSLDGITIEVSEMDANFYLRCGYKEAKEPVTNPAQKKHAGEGEKRTEEVKTEKEGNA